MRFTLAELEKKSQSRPQGYRQEVLVLSKQVGEQFYEIDDEAYEKLALKYKMPSALEMISNLVAAAKEALASGFDVRSPEETERVLKICVVCPRYVENGPRCGKCGCWLSGKVQLKAWHCPLKKW